MQLASYKQKWLWLYKKIVINDDLALISGLILSRIYFFRLDFWPEKQVYMAP
jgi:hypothetical protein